MLQWTCRLRDELERGGFFVLERHSQKLSEMREAEFVSPDGGPFPNDFRWEAFVASYASSKADTPPVYLFHRGDLPPFGVDRPAHLAVDRSSSIDQSIRSLSGQAVPDFTTKSIDVLWLSKTVFISPMEFFWRRVHKSYLYEYGITLKPRATSQSITCYATALSSFGRGEVEEPSSLAVQFLKHVSALVPESFFDRVWLKRNWDCPQRCPVDCIVQIHSIFANGTSAVAGTEKITVSVTGSSTINPDELRTLLSYQFIPNVRLRFDKDPGIGHRYCGRDPRPDAAAGVTGVIIKWPNLSIHTTLAMPSQLIDTISKIQPVNCICFSFDCRFWRGNEKSRRKWVETFIHPFLNGYLNSESVKLRFHLTEQVNKEDHTPQWRQWLADAMIPCKSKRMCVFTVDFRGKEEAGIIDCVKKWDQDIFPSLVANYLRQKLTPVVGKKVLPLAVDAINRGQIYRRTTGHAPFDMSVANAGLIFEFIKVAYG
jgi:hypothetical protein